MKKKSYFVIVIVFVLFILGTVAYIVFTNTKVYLEINQIQKVEITENLRKQLEEMYYSQDIIDQKTLNKLGIEVKDIKLNENVYYFYSIDERITEVSYLKYRADKEFSVYGPIMPDFAYKQDKGYLYVYEIYIPDEVSINLFRERVDWDER